MKKLTTKGFLKALTAGALALAIGLTATSQLSRVGGRVGQFFGGVNVLATTNGLSTSAQTVKGRIYLDAGHGGWDPGAEGQGKEREEYYNNLVANDVGRILQKYGLEVIYTRNGNVGMNLTPRTNKAKQYGCELLVSFHMNSAKDKTANGYETFTYGKQTGEMKLANAIHGHVNSLNYFTNRGIKQDNLHMTREFDGPAVLVEMGFISNTEDLDIMNEKEKRYNVGRAIARGILDYYGIDWRNNADAKFER